MDEIIKLLQGINLASVLSAAFFGALGFIAKAIVDFIREREIKKTEAKLETDKIQWEQKREFLLETVRTLLALDEITRRFLDDINHFHKLAYRNDDTYRKYNIEALCLHTLRFLGQLEKIYQAEVQLVLSETNSKHFLI